MEDGLSGVHTVTAARHAVEVFAHVGGGVKVELAVAKTVRVMLSKSTNATVIAALWTDISQSGQSGLPALRDVAVEDNPGEGGAYRSNAEERDAWETLVNSVTATQSAAQWMAI
jgi:hypothetical protein